MSKPRKRSMLTDWLAILRTLARSREFHPFVVWVSDGERVRRLLVPHPSTLRFPRSRCIVHWDHGRAGSWEFDPRYVVKVDLHLNPEELSERGSIVAVDHL